VCLSLSSRSGLVTSWSILSLGQDEDLAARLLGVRVSSSFVALCGETQPRVGESAAFVALCGETRDCL
jgi:hypothetical protein